MKKNTTVHAESSTPARDTSINTARRILAIEPTEADRQTARQLCDLYTNKQTPDMFRHYIFQVFWASAHHYGFDLVKNFTAKWRPLWPFLIAKLRTTGQLPTSITYSWEPSEEQEAEYEAEEKEEADARAIFDLIHNKAIRQDVRIRFTDEVNSVLDAVPVTDTWELFSVAWPLALESLNEEKAEDD
jgi:hypothetical protein